MAVVRNLCENMKYNNFGTLSTPFLFIYIKFLVIKLMVRGNIQRTSTYFKLARPHLYAVLRSFSYPRMTKIFIFPYILGCFQ